MEKGTMENRVYWSVVVCGKDKMGLLTLGIDAHLSTIEIMKILACS